MKSGKTQLLKALAEMESIPPRGLEALSLWLQECDCRSCKKFRKVIWRRRRSNREVGKQAE